MKIVQAQGHLAGNPFYALFSQLLGFLCDDVEQTATLHIFLFATATSEMVVEDCDKRAVGP